MKTAFRIIIMAISYLALFILGATSGIVHPACYAYIGAVLPLLFAFVYLYTAINIRGFGAAVALNGFVLVIGILAGESDWAFIVGMCVLSALAEIIRFFFGYDTRKGVRWSFLPFAFSFFTYTAHWRTDTEGALAAAVEEMPAGYDALMRPVIENIPLLIVVLLLTIPVAILSMRLAMRVMKNHVAMK